MAQFDSAIGYVLEAEGGYTCDPDDPGGETNFGICKRDHPNIDIRHLTRDAAVAIYRNQYWDYDGIHDQRVATKLLDMAVNMEGTGRAGVAVRIAQRASAIYYGSRLLVDGIYGPLTAEAMNTCNPNLLLNQMASMAIDHYYDLVAKNPRLARFLNGWLTRAAKLPAPLMSEVHA